MPTTDELRARDDADFGHIVLFDGIFYGFGDREELSSAYSPVGHSIRNGLVKQGTTLPESGNLRTGQFNDDTAIITIDDHFGDLARLFAAVDDTERSLGDVPVGGGLPVHPRTNIGLRTELHSKNLGTERIGPNGERHRWPAPVDYTLGGDHTIALPALDLAGTPVSDNPIVWAGRRVMVYRVYRDHVTYPKQPLVGWRPFEEAVEIFRGTVRDEGDIQGRRWRFDCDGAGSWLRKSLGLGYQSTPVRVVGVVELSTVDGANETGMGMVLSLVGGDGVIEAYGVRAFVTSITQATSDLIREELVTELAATAATVGVDGAFTATPGHSVSLHVDGSFRISVDAQIGVAIPPGAGAAVLQCCFHRKVWSMLGYDVEYQGALDADPEDEKAIAFAPVGQSGTFAAANDLGPDYWVAWLPTGRVDWPNGLSNNGVARQYSPLHPGGTTVLLHNLNDGRGQPLYLGDAALGGVDTSQSTVAHGGQLQRPVFGDPTDPDQPYQMPGGLGPADRRGLWLFTGKRRYAGTDVVFDEAWIGDAIWRAAGGQLDGCVSGDVIVVMRWLDAKLFGYDTKGDASSDWVARADVIDENAGQISAVPVLQIGYNAGDDLDRAHVVLQRLLLSSGTSLGWTGYEGGTVSHDRGGNEPSGDHTVVRDGEVPALGLGIPANRVHPPATWADEAALVDDDAILDVKVAFPPGFSSFDVIRALMQPIGWCWHLRGGRYGVWCPAHSLTLEDAEVVLNRSVKAAEYPDEGERREMGNELRKWAPIDKWAIDYNAAAGDGKPTQKLDLNSPDKGLRYRPGGVKETVPALFHRRAQFSTRVDVLSRWWARRHFEVKNYPVSRYVGEQCHFGTVVRITDPELADVLGQYGVTNRLGIVTSKRLDLGAMSTMLDVLVIADRTNTPRVHGPSGRALAYDSTTGRLYLEDDWTGVGSDGWSDAARFTEPTYAAMTAIGGNLRIAAWQFDGSTTSLTWSADVTGYNADESGSHYLTVTNPSGTFYRDMDTIIVPAAWGSQPLESWPRAILGAVSDSAGEFNNGAGTVPGHAWEE